jgi:RNase P subunit RPR2
VNIGKGWHRGAAVTQFDCDACETPILEGTDVAVRRTAQRMQFLHGQCYDERYERWGDVVSDARQDTTAAAKA